MARDPKKEFLEAYEKYADAIWRHCFFRLYNDRERALDIMQETFIKTWEYLARGNEIENIRAFLYRVATNLIIDSVRKKRTFSLDELTEQGFDPPDTSHRRIEADAEMAQISKLIEKLEPEYREVVVMRYIDDMSPKEIAGALGESENTVSVRVHRGIKKIREFLS